MKKMIICVFILLFASCGTQENNEPNNADLNNGAGKGDVPGAKIAIGEDCKYYEVCTDDGNCTQDVCEDGSYCKAKESDACDAVCTKYAATGEICQWDGGFANCDLAKDVCDFRGTKTCIPRPEKGEVCDGNQCMLADDLEIVMYCKRNPDNDPNLNFTNGGDVGTCQDLIPVGQPCPDGRGCVFTAFCSAENICKERDIPLNGACGSAVGVIDRRCTSGTYCDLFEFSDTENTCVLVEKRTCEATPPAAPEPKNVGQDCRGREVCTNGVCEMDRCPPGSTCRAKDNDACDGICTEFVATGEPCGVNQPCDISKDICDWDTNICVTRPKKGEACTGIQCALAADLTLELYCKTEAGQQVGVCEEYIKDGEPCHEGGGCNIYTSFCSSNGTCKERDIPVNGACGSAVGVVDRRCERGSYCNLTEFSQFENTCVPAEKLTCD